MTDAFDPRILCMVPFSAIAMSACAAPRVEIYTELVCRTHRPDYTFGDRNIYPHSVIPGSIDVASLPEDISSMANTWPFYVGATIPEAPKLLGEKEDKQRECFEDPVIQAGAAKLIAGG